MAARESGSILLLLLFFFATTANALPPDRGTVSINVASTAIDQTTYIDANDILMFVHNDGRQARDLAHVFPFDYGTFFPYIDTTHIASGDLAKSPLYAAGIFVGGKVNGEIRIAAAEYGTEFVPGPMADSTFQPDNPLFRVYKLYADSLAGSPNSDYLAWPVDQGAPTSIDGLPRHRGRQSLWTVFNDADPTAHDIDPGLTAPLGIEVRQSVWADTGGPVLNAVFYDSVAVTSTGNSRYVVAVEITDAASLTGHAYEIYIDSSAALGWNFDIQDVTMGSLVLTDQPLPSAPIDFDGVRVSISGPKKAIASFEVTANATGVLPAPVPGALASVGFPTPGNEDPGPDQQTDGARWALHGPSVTPSSEAVSPTDYDQFLNYIGELAGQYDYEIRFTGSLANPGVGGGYARNESDPQGIWVPFELWRTGFDTPDDTTDDVRLVPHIREWADNDSFGIDSYGTPENCVALCDHSAHPDDNDPWTDWFSWYLPLDTSAGQAGYLVNEAKLINGTMNSDDLIGPVLSNIVLIKIDGGEQPPFGSECPEQGTVFRLVGADPNQADTFSFTPSVAFAEDTVTGYEDAAVYISYTIFNRGPNVIDSFFVGLWTDPDVGIAGDDLVSCDTLEHQFFAYNGYATDDRYGASPPAIGWRFLQGLVSPDPDSLSIFDGKPRAGYRDLGMHAFSMWFDGLDPDAATETFWWMKGLDGKTGEAQTYNGDVTRYKPSGDPVTGTGDLLGFPHECRAFASTGPVTLNPGDSQYVLVKMAVAPGEDNLQSITLLRDMLSQNPWAPSAGEMVSSADTVDYTAASPITIDVGNFADIAFGDIEPTSLGLNDQLAPDSVTYVSGHPQFGDAYRLWFNASDILLYTGPTDSLDFFINGHTTNGRDLYALGSLALKPAPMGDTDGDGDLDIDDLNVLIDYLFLLGPEPAWPHAADAYCDGAGQLTITDLTHLVRYFFHGAPEPGICANWTK